MGDWYVKLIGDFFKSLVVTVVVGFAIVACAGLGIGYLVGHYLVR